MLLLAAGLLAVMLPPDALRVKANYHDRLLDLCEERAGRACCRASVHAMRREQARLFEKDVGCASGTRAVSLRCPASFTWCSYKTRAEIRGDGEYHVDEK